MAATVSIKVTSDASKAISDMKALDSASSGAAKGVSRLESASERAGSAADGLASTTAQVAGGIGDMAGALAATGVVSEETAGKMELASTVIMGVTGAADLANAAIEKMGLATKLATVAETAATAARKVATGVQLALNAAMAANPIGLVVLALVALAVAVGVAWAKSETFRNVVTAAWGAVKDKVLGVLNWFKDTLLPWFTDKLPQGFKDAWQKARERTVEVVGGILEWVGGIPEKVGNRLSGLLAHVRDAFAGAMNAGKEKVTGIGATILEWIQGIPAKIGQVAGAMTGAGRALMQAFVDGVKNAAGIVEGIASSVWNGLRSLLNAGIDKINAALTFTIKLPGKDLTINAPDIPHLASGGVVTQPTVALIGEAGPEAVVPLDKLGSTGGGPVTFSRESLAELAELIVGAAANVSHGAMRHQARSIALRGGVS